MNTRATFGGCRGGITLLFIALVTAGCQSQSIPVKHMDEADLTAPLEKSTYVTPYDPNMKTVRITLAKVTCAVAVSGRKSEFEECVRSNLSELLTNCRNVQLANRAVSDEAQAEWSAIAAGAANPNQVPKSPGLTIPEYIIKVGVSQVERNISGKGDASDWSIYIAIHSDSQKREGAVELNVEVVDLATQTNVAAFRVRGLLNDEKKSSSGSVFGIGGGNTKFFRTPENQAIREACEHATTNIFESLRQRNSLAKAVP